MRLKLLGALTLLSAPLLLCGPLAPSPATAAPQAPPPLTAPNVGREVDLSGSEVLGLAIRLRAFVRALQAGQTALFKTRWHGDTLKYHLGLNVSVTKATGRMTLDDWLDLALTVWVIVDEADHTGTYPVDVQFQLGGSMVSLKGNLIVKPFPKPAPVQVPSGHRGRRAFAPVTRSYALLA